MKKYFISLMTISALLTFLAFENFGGLPSAQAYQFGDFDDESEEIDMDNFGDLAMGTIKMEGEFLDGDLLKISIVAQELKSPVLGVAFHLNYENKKLSFLKYEPGEFLERGGDPFYLVSNEQNKSKIIFGETLRRDDSFPLGDGKLADVYFQILEEGEFSFGFENGIVSTLDTVRQDIDKINWENMIIDRNGQRQIETGVGADNVFAVNTDTDKKDFSWKSVFLPITIAVATLAVIMIYFFLIKKKHYDSVNFK